MFQHCSSVKLVQSSLETSPAQNNIINKNIFISKGEINLQSEVLVFKKLLGGRGGVEKTENY